MSVCARERGLTWSAAPSCLVWIAVVVPLPRTRKLRPTRRTHLPVCHPEGLRGQSPVGPAPTSWPGPCLLCGDRDPAAWSPGCRKGSWAPSRGGWAWQDQAGRGEASSQPLCVPNSIPDATPAARGRTRSAFKGPRVRAITQSNPPNNSTWEPLRGRWHLLVSPQCAPWHAEGFELKHTQEEAQTRAFRA